MTYLDDLKKRRSRYDLTSELPMSEEALVDLVEVVTLEVPDAFNMQSQRVVVLTGERHRRFWQVVDEAFEGQVSADKLAGFSGAAATLWCAATLLFATDTATVEDLQSQFALYTDKFPGWARESVGMLQYAVWTALATEGVGANIQHYNPVIDKAVHEEFGVPAEWELVSQMVVGGIGSEPGEKELKPISERVVTR
ncbi:nitroreductase family protein [Nanchangia anserum]|uniref:nitroreductase family protein n=1 Tax=Nanchangia anserum TaxID=2692125 RepID=UPI0018838583|nr:nitroreductase family protein [Nanchangia anserum]QOX81964.1 nitroreductase family protein [Nanchangia anserum]